MTVAISWNEYALPAALLAIAGSVTVPVYQHVRAWRCRRRLNARPGLSIERELIRISEREFIEEADASRLWNAIAAFYGIPPDKLRATDRLNVELRGCFLGPFNIVERRCLALHVGPAQDRATQVGSNANADLGDLVLLLRRFEIEMKRHIVDREIDSTARNEYEWQD